MKILKLPNGKFRIQKPKGPELFDGPPDEPRDWHGRWTSGGIGQGGPSVASGISPQKKAEIEARKNQAGKDFASKIKNSISPEKKSQLEERRKQSEAAFAQKSKNSGNTETFSEIGSDFIDRNKVDQFARQFKYDGEDEEYLEEYAQLSNFDINNDLRNLSGEKHSNEKFRQIIKGIDVAISKNKTNKDINVYRGISYFSQSLGIPEGNGAIGSVISDHAYTSTSINARIATSFADSRSPEVGIFRIKVPKGTNVAYIGHHEEYEVLLGRNSKYKITGYSENNGIKVYDAEIVR